MDDTEYAGNQPNPRFRQRQNKPDGTPRRHQERGGDETPRGRPQRDRTPSDVQPDEDNDALDRDWYAGDDGGGHTLGEDSYNPFGMYQESSWEATAQDATSKAQKVTGRFDSRKEQRQRDNDAWEMNRMVTSGVAQRRDWTGDFDEEEATRVHLLTHELRPPFLEVKT
ncbi:hypothetical protein IMZ48_12165, partial [Candidatus Bathyarchaeota archaeon]|nr:hypothetical protein [Candidatus Bathyarchaeota archaeon]